MICTDRSDCVSNLRTGVRRQVGKGESLFENIANLSVTKNGNRDGNESNGNGSAIVIVIVSVARTESEGKSMRKMAEARVTIIAGTTITTVTDIDRLTVNLDESGTVRRRGRKRGNGMPRTGHQNITARRSERVQG
jgi:hypothetical protein